MIGVAWLVLWSRISTRPDILAKPVAGDAGTRTPSFADPALWAFMCAYAMGALPLGFVLYNAPLYLANSLGASQRLIGELLWAPPLGWELGYFVWGWFADRLCRKEDQMVSGLGRLMAACGVMSLGFAAIPLLKSPVSVMAALFFVMFVASGFIVLPVAYATHVYSPAHGG
jgi:ACS family hexuronate transporter-like MFS transporter